MATTPARPLIFFCRDYIFTAQKLPHCFDRKPAESNFAFRAVANHGHRRTYINQVHCMFMIRNYIYSIYIYILAIYIISYMRDYGIFLLHTSFFGLLKIIYTSMSWVFLSEAGELNHQALEKYDGFTMNSLRYIR